MAGEMSLLGIAEPHATPFDRRWPRERFAYSTTTVHYRDFLEALGPQMHQPEPPPHRACPSQPLA